MKPRAKCHRAFKLIEIPHENAATLYTYTPIEVQVGKLVGEALNVIWI